MEWVTIGIAPRVRLLERKPAGIPVPASELVQDFRRGPSASGGTRFRGAARYAGDCQTDAL